MEPKLITKAEARAFMACDACGVTVPKYPWPKGWTECGISSWIVKRDTVDPTLMAYWCPLHYNSRFGPNPTHKELRVLRERLLEAERNKEQPVHESALEAEPVTAPVVEETPQTPTVKWSARREGLVPMRTNQ